MSERYMHLPLLPLELVAVHLEADTFWLENVQGFDIVTSLESGVLSLEVRKEVKLLARHRNSVAVRVLGSVGEIGGR